MKKLVCLPYKMGSESAKLLARELQIKRVYPNRAYRYKSNHIILNWGSSSHPTWHKYNTRYINDPYNVGFATNKTSALNRFKDNSVKCPIFFTNKQDLIHYTEENNYSSTIYCRTVLSGHSGKGIVLANSVSELVDAPLYTLRFPAQKEWRIHVFGGEVVDYAKKSRRNGQEERATHMIRNSSNGWIFRRGGVEPSEAITTEAVKAVQSLGLDFGAVDIAEDVDGNVCVYEVNTAIGIGGESTLQSYTNAFKRYLDNANNR